MQIVLFQRGSQNPNQADFLCSYLSILRESQRHVSDFSDQPPWTQDTALATRAAPALLSLTSQPSQAKEVQPTSSWPSLQALPFQFFCTNAWLARGKEVGETLAWTQALFFCSTREHFKLEISESKVISP